MIGYLAGAIAVLLAALWYAITGKKSATALLTNLDEKEKLLSKDTDLAKNTGLLSAEEQKRKELENAPKDSSNLVDFFNKP